MREERTRLVLGLPRGVLRSWRLRDEALVTVASDTADVEETDCRRVNLGRGELSVLDDGTAVRVDVVEREEDEEDEAGDGERGGDIGAREGGTSGFGISRAC